MISDPWFYLLAVPVVCLVGLSKGGFLSNLGILGVPLLALAISPVQAAAIMLPILILMDAIAVWAYRRSFDRSALVRLIPAAAAGIAIGWLTAAYVTDGHIRLIVGIVALAFTINHWRPLAPPVAASGSQRTRRKPGPLSGMFWGGLTGFTSFVSHAGGPPASMYLLPLRLEKTYYVGTTAMLFAAVNLIKVPPYLMLGQFSTANLATSAALLPAAPLSMLASIWLVRRIPQEPFYRIAYGCLFIVALKLIWDGVASII